MRMRAAVFTAPGKPAEIIDDIDIKDPGPGEVRVQVKYCGICASDYSVVFKQPFPQIQPIIVGHEASGIVESVGPGVSHLAIGDHVILTPVPPCGNCYFCTRGEHALCEQGMAIMTNTFSDGSTGLSHNGQPVLRGVGLGAMAEYVVTQATGAIKIPKDIPLEHACVIGCAVQTGTGAVLNTAAVEPGATVLILGLGGIGMAAVQGARIAGATTIIATDPIAARRQQALAFGATHVADPGSQDVVQLARQLTQNIGVDYAFETAGIARLVEDCVHATRSGGTTVCVGAPHFEEKVTLDNFVLFAATEKKLCGCLLGSCNSLHEIPRLLRLYQQGLLDLSGLITARRPLAEINEAFADFAEGKGIRTVLQIG